MDQLEIKRGDIVLCDLTFAVGAEQKGLRPCLVVSNDIGNRFSPVVGICPITSKVKKMLPTHVNLNLKESSIALLEQCRFVDKGRVLHKLDAVVSTRDMTKVDEALMISFGLFNYIPEKQVAACV
ncbi:type II toxin-antitoxin system PemK/MazF family toxin [Paenibacillus cremeus]|uniref:mRNA interferase n=1 Tax=Paenibacillus cremeus TaxID=2163881 RepID=A0A559KCR1_9BACL|nr:type II toxin-antitoxin system PemK/MazF family toxin [Paenibacillus cremeus]TVY09917.1 type II toxin-antitoxin system PemK/MazF family toxin [Paenibacillus cremeus]